VDWTSVTITAGSTAMPGKYGFDVTGIGSVSQCQPYVWPEIGGDPYPIYIQVLAGLPPRYTPEEKAMFTKIADDIDKATLALPVLGGACALSKAYKKICGGIVTGVGVAAKVIEKSYKDAAKDPPDADWTQVSPVVPMAYTPLSADGTNDQASTDAGNALLQNLAMQVGYESAITTAINRSSSAYAAGDTNTSNMQLMVASQFNNELNAYVNAWPALQSAFTAALVTDGLPVTSITSAQMVSFQQSVAANGLPADYVAACQQAGMDSATISEFASEIVAATPFNAPSLDVAFNTAAISTDAPGVGSAVTTMASSNNVVPLQLGHSIYGTGKYKESSGTLVTFKMQDSCSTFTKKCTGTFNLTDSTASVALTKLKVVNAATMGTTYAIIDGTYTDTLGNPQSFVEVAYTPTGGSTVNHVAAGLSTGYDSNGQKTVGSVSIK
jgi:hypothetical protein